ncbi:hypothetical protein A4A49_11743 [Nicotiana attenuata]|uniref:Uncharacterized protein n=1 Tax=Nicotiana attenuata TaxID=49451 RepID=A0A314L7M9_NICAT|nr:hypothetical protein A4A49_11743 [Nicotiana attenuata]
METGTGPLLMVESSLKEAAYMETKQKHPFPQPKLSNNGRSHQNPQKSDCFLIDLPIEHRLWPSFLPFPFSSNGPEGGR